MQIERTGRNFLPVRSLFLFLILGSLPAFALSPEGDLQRLNLRGAAAKAEAWNSPAWLNLLYYEKNLLGHYRSQCSGAQFFLSRWGDISPRLELEAAVDGLYFAGKPDESPECRFPERYRWLREKLKLSPETFPPPACAEFEDWKAQLAPESVSLIFAAGYLNNPSTLYGHTFLRLHKKGGQGADLLDYTINYAATTGEDKGLFYALKGLVGAYPGQFSTIPYYLKIQEYRNLENRDLWEFPLGLTSDEVDRLLRHSWELGKASFPYLFFTRNCSWQLMPLLDIVRPGGNLARQFTFWVIPSDTAKAAIAASPAAAPSWRPALWKKVEWQRSQLTEDEKAAVLNLANGETARGLALAGRLPPERHAAVLETASDYLSWRYYAGRIGYEVRDKFTDPLLAERAKLGQQAPFTSSPKRPPSPAGGHESFRLGAGLAGLPKGAAYEVQARFAVQDLLDSPEGYLPDAALEMGALRLRYEPRYNRVYMKEGRLVRVISLNPWDDWIRRQSWELSAGVEQADETGRASGTSAVWAMSAGAGLASELPGPVRQVWYLMGVADTAFGPALAARWRAGGGFKAGILAEAGKARLLAECRYISYALGDGAPLWAGSAGLSYKLAKDSSLRAEYAWRGSVKEAGLYFHQFFFSP